MIMSRRLEKPQKKSRPEKEDHGIGIESL